MVCGRGCAGVGAERVGALGRGVGVSVQAFWLGYSDRRQGDDLYLESGRSEEREEGDRDGTEVQWVVGAEKHDARRREQEED